MTVPEKPSSDPDPDDTTAGTEVGRYLEDLLVALRMRDVPGDRIGEALAEVESHVVHTGETAREAFGPPKEYAARLVSEGQLPSRPWFTGRNVALAVTSFVGAWLLTMSILNLVTREATLYGLPVRLTLVIGLLGVLTAAVVVVRNPDPVTDPRTGREREQARWPLVVAVATPVALLVWTVLVVALT